MITIPFLPDYTIILSDRNDGSLKGEEKVKAFLDHQGVKKDVAFLKVEHGSQRVHVKDSQSTDLLGDAIVTSNPNLCLAMVVGDCFPIILLDKKSHTVAMIHGGWRSLLQSTIDLTMKELKYFDYRCQADQIIAWIGPGIRVESNVSQQLPVQSLFPEWQQFVNQSEQGYHVDLVSFIRSRLIACHIKDENIFDYGKDTYLEKETFFSHRRATLEGDEDGRFVVAIYKN